MFKEIIRDIMDEETHETSENTRYIKFTPGASFAKMV